MNIFFFLVAWQLWIFCCLPFEWRHLLKFSSDEFKNTGTSFQIDRTVDTVASFVRQQLKTVPKSKINWLRLCVSHSNSVKDKQNLTFASKSECLERSQENVNTNALHRSVNILNVENIFVQWIFSHRQVLKWNIHPRCATKSLCICLCREMVVQNHWHPSLMNNRSQNVTSWNIWTKQNETIEWKRYSINYLWAHVISSKRTVEYYYVFLCKFFEHLWISAPARKIWSHDIQMSIFMWHNKNWRRNDIDDIDLKYSSKIE